MQHILKHFGKYVAALSLVLVGLFAAGCEVTPENTTPVQRTEMQSIQDRIDAAKAKGDALAIQAAEEEMRAFEDRVVRERAGPIVGALAAAHPVVGALSPLLLGLAPLLGKRGRRQAKKVVKKMSAADFAGAGMAALAYAGIAHTSPAARAAEDKAELAAKGAPVPLAAPSS